MKVSDNASEITNLFGIVFKRAERNKMTNVKRSAATAKTTSKKGTFELNIEETDRKTNKNTGKKC